MKHILIINQHGENRGDEAAMRAMLSQFAQELGDVRFTLLYQFRDRSLRLAFKQQVDAYPIVVPPHQYLGLLLFTLSKLVGLEPNWLLSANMRNIIAAYRSADLVVSAPGGPYFGDIYANHELFHWWYVWLAVLFRKPLFLYATSAGPFNLRWINPVRRKLYRRFPFLVVREELSAQYLHGLLGQDFPVRVTADSAIQAEFSPFPRSDYFEGERAGLREKFLVAVSLNNYRYPGAADPQTLRHEYNRKMVELMTHLATRRDCHFLFLPQLYGKVHSDVPFLEQIGQRLPAEVSWEIVDPALDSDMQRRLFAMCDLHIASRYHPAIFGNTTGVPGLCIYYEHKALGFMRQLGLERFALNIRSLDAAELKRVLDELLEQREALVRQLEQRVPALRERARQTTKLAVTELQDVAAAETQAGSTHP